MTEPISFSRSDFETSLEGYMQFSLVLFGAVGIGACADKQAILDLAQAEADALIQRVLETHPIVQGFVTCAREIEAHELVYGDWQVDERLSPVTDRLRMLLGQFDDLLGGEYEDEGDAGDGEAAATREDPHCSEAVGVVGRKLSDAALGGDGQGQL